MITLRMLVALSFLNARDSEIVIDHIVVGQTFQQIGDRQGVTRERIRTIEKRGLRQLEGLLRDYEAAA